MGVYVPGLLEVVATDAASLGKLLDQGTAAKHTGGTAMNARSSRSHTIFVRGGKQTQDPPKP